MLEVREIHTYYGDSHVLQGVSLSMSRGQVVGILGRNGMGKTTLIRSIIGFTVPGGGRSFSRTGTSRPGPRTGPSRSAWAWCLKAAGSSPR